MHASARRVQRELADGDAHAAGSEVAEPEDPLVIGGDDQPDVTAVGIAQQFRHPADVIRRDPQPAGTADDPGGLAARRPGQAERVAFGLSERGVLVQQRPAQDLRAARRSRVGVTVAGLDIHCGLPADVPPIARRAAVGRGTSSRAKARPRPSPSSQPAVISVDRILPAMARALAGLPAARPLAEHRTSGMAGRAAPGAAVLPALDRLDEIPGIARHAAQVIIAEIGLDMSVFPTAGHLASRAKLSPRTIQSGLKNRSGKTGKGNPYLKGALGEASAAAAKTGTFLGERYRRLAKRIGKLKALVAVARSILVIVWVRREALSLRMEVRDRPSPRRRSGGVKLEAA